MRNEIINRPNGQKLLIVDDEQQPPTYTYAMEATDILGNTYWSTVNLEEKASADTVLKVFREVTFGDATLGEEPAP